jgi:hypothetical protein
MQYKLGRRYHKQMDGTPLPEGYTQDITIKALNGGKYMLSDKNSETPGGLRVDSLAELLGALVPAIVQNHHEFFGVEEGSPPIATDTVEPRVPRYLEKLNRAK